MAASELVEIEIPKGVSTSIVESFGKISSCPYRAFRLFLSDALTYSAPLYSVVANQLYEFRSNPASPSGCVIRGVGIDRELPPTPNSQSEVERLKTTSVTEACLASVSAVLGIIVAFTEEEGGDAVRNILPTRKSTELGSGFFGTHQLRMHTDVAWSSARPDFLIFHCLRGHQNGPSKTIVTSARDICEELKADDLERLQEPHFHIGIPESFRASTAKELYWSDPVAVIQGPLSLPELRLNLNFIRSFSNAHRESLQNLATIAAELGVEVALNPGDMLVLDNRKAVHGRESYNAEYDGNDRWLQQVYVSERTWCSREAQSLSAPHQLVAKLVRQRA